jgi:hypothetical protein
MSSFELCDPGGFEGPRIQGFKWNTIESQRVAGLAKVIGSQIGIWIITASLWKRQGLTSQMKDSLCRYLCYSRRIWNKQPWLICGFFTYLMDRFANWKPDINDKGYRFNWTNWIDYVKRVNCKNRKDVKIIDKIPIKTTPWNWEPAPKEWDWAERSECEESLNPWILGPSSPTKLEKNQYY